jgi:hypothetical protein
VAEARKTDISAKERINAWTVGLAGGLIEGAPLRLAGEIARVLNEEDKLHIIPIVTRGATEKVNSLLHDENGGARVRLRNRMSSPQNSAI